MMEPTFAPKLTEPFSSGERIAIEIAINLGPQGLACLAALMFWTWWVPFDPAWTPPPLNETITVNGGFASATDARQPRGYALVTLGGSVLRLRCEPYADASPLRQDYCLSGRGRLGDYAGRRVVVRYYEFAGETGIERVLLSAYTDKRWLLAADDQAKSLKSGGKLQRSREISYRVQMTMVAVILPLGLAIHFFRTLRRRKSKAPPAIA
jgi:hypothetical protein